MRDHGHRSRRDALRNLVAAGTAIAAAPAIVRAQSPLTLEFLTIPDPDGWHESLRLKGDWLVFAISDGVNFGYGEASHSRDDAAGRDAGRAQFVEHYSDFSLSLESLATREADLARLEPDFVNATALSGINQALCELLAKREQVPVWQLLRDRPGRRQSRRRLRECVGGRHHARRQACWRVWVTSGRHADGRRPLRGFPAQSFRTDFDCSQPARGGRAAGWRSFARVRF